jgi:hypothetical protein
MSGWVAQPNLPASKVKYVLLGSKYFFWEAFYGVWGFRLFMYLILLT